MAKGDDIRRRKTNKANRKKIQKDPSSVSARVASIIAAKKRRKSGRRSKCQGMCFSLPTPEDPFNDRHGEKDANIKHKKMPMPSQANAKISMNKESDVQRKRICDSHQGSINHGESKRLKVTNLKNEKKLLVDTDKIGKANLARLGNKKLQLFAEHQVVVDQKRKSLEKSVCPSKFLLFCLKSINDSLLRDGELNRAQDEPLMVDTWGVEFWKRFSVGKDILETSGTSPTLQQIAWVASTAADTIASNEKEGLSFTNPFLLYLVPSQKDAVKVRSVCKPLKALGIHTVSLHPGASMDHQIQGLKSCEPEFIVATPERLWEVVSLKAIDISRVSLLVVDGLASLSKSGLLEVVKCIRQSISRNSRTVVFQGCSSAEAVQSILMGPFHE
ncbi:hypothetical protein Nepgr_015078 [Nepenthes gracilis]|uniref:DEAD/DEAH-box helicase domain-containing protein n=1 Tax=Nepenthes gracilis TaxID=150966 RepID=A0AAD3SLJ3_NEPGR|nr:hypothetical protein Nepgr_015078 [Nepenthes gracilis]